MLDIPDTYWLHTTAYYYPNNILIHRGHSLKKLKTQYLFVSMIHDNYKTFPYFHWPLSLKPETESLVTVNK